MWKPAPIMCSAKLHRARGDLRNQNVGDKNTATETQQLKQSNQNTATEREIADVQIINLSTKNQEIFLLFL